MATTRTRLADPSSVMPHLSDEESRAKGKAGPGQGAPGQPRDLRAGSRTVPTRLRCSRSRRRPRVPELVPIRYGRMLVSPFTFFRGAALIMASDLSTTPRSGLTAQICGDAHLSNFGVFGSPERQLVFDCNDFDETLPGPWEWDVKRLAASIVVAGRDLGFRQGDAPRGDHRRSASVTGRSCGRWRPCRTWRSGTPMSTCEGARRALEAQAAASGSKAEAHMAATASKATSKALTKDSHEGARQADPVVDGERRIISDPPLIVPLEELFPGCRRPTTRRRCSAR